MGNTIAVKVHPPLLNIPHELDGLYLSHQKSIARVNRKIPLLSIFHVRIHKANWNFSFIRYSFRRVPLISFIKKLSLSNRNIIWSITLLIKASGEASEHVWFNIGVIPCRVGCVALHIFFLIKNIFIWLGFSNSCKIIYHRDLVKQSLKWFWLTLQINILV